MDKVKKLLESQGTIFALDAAWKSKFLSEVQFLSEFMAEGESDTTSTTAAVVIEGGTSSQDVDFAVAYCTWKQIGIKDETIDWIKEVQVIPRLRWVLTRVRNDILIWDYEKEEVVHFITLEQPAWQHAITTCHLIDMPDLDAVIYFRGFEKMFWISNLQNFSPRGGRTDFDELTLPIDLSPRDLYDRTYSYFLENASLLYSNVASIATSKDDSGQWRLAISHIDRRGVSIFKAGTQRHESLEFST